MATYPGPTKRQDGKFTVYEFEADHSFKVLTSGTGWWTVYREPKGMQRNCYGKTFHKAEDMMGWYRHPEVKRQLARIVDGSF